MTTTYLQKSFHFGRGSTEALREMLQGIDELFSGVLEYVPTTGDTDPATVEWPADYWTDSKWTTASNDSQIFRRDYQLQDEFSETHPIYVRVGVHPVRFSSSPFSRDALMLSYWVAHALDTSTGVLTDITLSPTYPSTFSGSIDTQGSIRGASLTWSGTHLSVGDRSGFVFLPFTNTYHQHPAFFGVERARNLDGSPRADAYTILHNFRSNEANRFNENYGLPSIRTVHYASRLTHESAVPVMFPYSMGGQVMSSTVSLASGGVGPAFPWTLTAPSAVPWQSKLFLSVPIGDFPSGVFTTRVFGQSQQFLPIWVNPASTPMTSTTNVGYSGFGVSLGGSGYLHTGCLAVNVTGAPLT